MSQEIDILATRFNYEAEVMLGASQQEIMRALLWVALPTTLLIAFLLLPLLGNFMYGIAAGVVFGIGTFLASLIMLKRSRKDEELGYLTQKLQRTLSKSGLAYVDVIHRTGTWMIGRLL